MNINIRKFMYRNYNYYYSNSTENSILRRIGLAPGPRAARSLIAAAAKPPGHVPAFAASSSTDLGLHRSTQVLGRC